jgi:hypothetical protein
MCMHASLDELNARFPIPLPFLRELLRFGWDGDGMDEGACARCAEHEGTTEEANKVVLFRR